MTPKSINEQLLEWERKADLIPDNARPLTSDGWARSQDFILCSAEMIQTLMVEIGRLQQELLDLKEGRVTRSVHPPLELLQDDD